MIYARELILPSAVAEINVIKNTPRKLNTAAISIALRSDIHLVETQVAIAFGASVQPLTSITPRVSTTAISISGLAII
jgi:hypothetical protein